jgi:hypothetical protein
MKIETKFSLGETVWFMKDNKAISGDIKGVNYTENTDRKITVSYYIASFPYVIYENRLFATKQELLDSL